LKQLIEQYPDTKPDETGVDPDQACLYLADVTMKAGLLHQAARLYGKVFNLGFSLESQRTSALGAGRCFYERQDYENAAYWLTRYINLWELRTPNSELRTPNTSRDFYLAWYLLGKAYIAQGQHQKAFDAFQHALSGPLLMQEYVEAVSALVKAYVKLGHFVKALELLENISSRQFSQKESIEILLLKASILRSAGLVDEAIAVLGDRAQYLPSSQLKTKIFFERARCSEARGDLEPARKSLTEILTLVEPGSLAHEVRYELADVCLKLGENTQAIFVCLQLLDSQPEAEIKQKALDLLATAYTRQKDYDKAALALLGQWKPVENTERELRTSNSELRTPSPIKQDIQHNEG